jgi:hypothetical protein
VTADPSADLEARCRTREIEVMYKPLKPAEFRALVEHLLAAGRAE